jgi:hypothetical protein
MTALVAKRERGREKAKPKKKRRERRQSQRREREKAKPKKKRNAPQTHTPPLSPFPCWPPRQHRHGDSAFGMLLRWLCSSIIGTTLLYRISMVYSG